MKKCRRAGPRPLCAEPLFFFFATTSRRTNSWGKMVKVLVAGDVKGSVTQLLAKVAQYHK